MSIEQTSKRWQNRTKSPSAPLSFIFPVGPICCSISLLLLFICNPYPNPLLNLPILSRLQITLFTFFILSSWFHVFLLYIFKIHVHFFLFHPLHVIFILNTFPFIIKFSRFDNAQIKIQSRNKIKKKKEKNKNLEKEEKKQRYSQLRNVQKRKSHKEQR